MGRSKYYEADRNPRQDKNDTVGTISNFGKLCSGYSYLLSEEEIQKIAQYVPEALKEIPVLIAAKNDVGEYTAFMGLDDKKISMLFVSDQERHKGIGKMLIRYGIEHYGINEVCVNVQNPQAVCF